MILPPHSSHYLAKGMPWYTHWTPTLFLAPIALADRLLENQILIFNSVFFTFIGLDQRQQRRVPQQPQARQQNCRTQTPKKKRAKPHMKVHTLLFFNLSVIKNNFNRQ